MAAQAFSRVAVLGLGLMGGSLGLALRAAGLAATRVGYDKDAGTAARAVALGAVDAVAASAAEAATGADLIVLASPVLAERELLAGIAPAVAADAIVTDLGSTKQHVVEWAQELLPVPWRFIAGHPMAGREVSGIEAATAGLFAGAVWCLTPTPGTDPAALAVITDLVRGLGATPLLLDPAEHDEQVAAISHLPLVAAAALVRAVSQGPEWQRLSVLAAGGFRDTTRIASGDARMARDICLTNRVALVGWLDRYIADLSEARQRIAEGSPDLGEWFEAAREAREDWLRRRSS